IIPLRLTNPTVGLIPASPFDEHGQTIEPSVSVPMPAAPRFAEIPAPVPELDPQGLRSSEYGFFVSPPRPLHPLVEWLDRMFAHSLRLVLPRITAPDARSFAATNESFGGLEPTSASDPAVVIMRSAVSMLSLIRTGMPCIGPRAPLALRSGSSSITALTAGPCLSISLILAVYLSTSERAVNLPEFMPSCNSVMVISSSSKGFTSATTDAAGLEISRAAPSAG